MSTWLTELDRLAAEAKEYVIGCHECHAEYIAACTPERIAALVRVAAAAQQVLHVSRYTQETADKLAQLDYSLRDLEATP